LLTVHCFSGEGSKEKVLRGEGREKESLILKYNLKMTNRTKKYNLEIVNPKLAKQWHPTKNKKLTPRDVTPGVGKKVWWICQKGHEWEALINNRNSGRGCPYCARLKPCIDNCLQTVNPNLAKQWHPTKNGKLTPKDISAGSGKRVWWICNKGHEWQTPVAHRNLGDGCPYCAGRLVCDDNCLKTVNPVLAKQWHPTKNGKLSPKDVVANYTKKVWWICENKHEWRAMVRARNQGSGCPHCPRKRYNNNLEETNPILAKQWHPTKNRKLTPRDVTPGIGKKVWWICEKGHEWEARIFSRNRGHGCPYCYGLKRKMMLKRSFLRPKRVV